MENYLSDTEMASLVEAIRQAEQQSTAEIRVHVDNSTMARQKEENARVALEIFRSLYMEKTPDRNAVLFHVNFRQRYLTIIADEAANARVNAMFWDVLHDKTTASFGSGRYFEGLRDGILETGKELQKHFPFTGTKTNELPDEITFS